jgi:dihydropteroate synthase
MPVSIRLLKIDSLPDALREVARVGAGPEARERLAAKMVPVRIRLGDVPTPAANILKQEMLALGGDAAVTRGAAACAEPVSPVILTGTLAHMRRLARALADQPFGLAALGERLGTFLGDVTRADFTVKTRGGDLRFEARTLVLGVLNVTPDSFSDGGRFRDPEAAVAQALRMAEEGADAIDVGGESTRPGAAPVDAAEEIDRVIPVIERLAGWLSIPISIDTTKREVAAAALGAGASLVNVVGALAIDPGVADAAAAGEAGVILSHMRGRPEAMYAEASYPDGVMGGVVEDLAAAIALAEARGVDRERVIVDPGLGFGKRAAHTLEALRRLPELRSLGRPILVGTSRKSFIGSVTGLDVDSRFPGDAAATAIAVLHGARMVRVHEVAPILPVLRMAEAIRDADAYPEA